MDRFVSLTVDEKRHALAKILLHETARSRGARPLSFGQEARWRLARSALGSSVDNMSFAWRIKAPVDLAVLELAFREMLNRHGSLRSVFRVEGGRMVRRCLPNIDVKLVENDRRGAPEAVVSAEVARDAAEPFDLENGPLARMRLYRRADNEFTLLLSAHHIVVDFWSLGILLKALSKAYLDIVRGRSTPTGLPEANYQSFVLWENELVISQRGQSDLRYWGSQLGDGLEFVELPLDRPWSERRGFRDAEHGFSIIDARMDQLKAAAANSGCTLFVLLLAVFDVVLHSYTGQRSFAVVVPTISRSQPEFENVVGDFANHMVLRAELDPRMAFADFLSEMHERVLTAMTHRDFPYPLISDRVEVRGVPTGAVPYPVKFNMPRADTLKELSMNASSRDESKIVVPMEAFEIELELIDRQITATCDVHLGIMETRKGLFGSLQYNTEVLDQNTVEGMVGRFTHLAELVTQRTDLSIGELGAIARSGG